MALLSGIGLLVIVIVLVLAVTILIEYEQGTVSSILIAAVLIAAYLSGNLDSTIQWTKSNIDHVILLSIAYLTIGVLYSFLKWYRYLKKHKEQNKRYHITYPKAAHHKSAIMRWIGYWPFGIILDIATEPLIFIMDLLESTYDSISKSVFEDEEV